jgi:cytochrome c biogenesis protein CcmG/thiol:disulfide interchange protein DsbE
MKALKLIIVGLAFAGFMGLFWFGLDNDPTKLPSQLINKTIPPFSVNDLLNPQKKHTEAIFNNKISLINIWASWCASCYQEHPYWSDYAKIPDLQIIGLNYKDKREKGLDFLRTEGNPYALILSDENGRLGIDLGVYGAPETFIVGPDAKVRYRYSGPLTPQVFEETFKPLIDKIRKGF